MKRHLKALVAVAAAGAIAVAPGAASAQTGDQTIAEIASGNPEFSTLVAALGAADLVGPFDSCDDPDLTVFAPTNAAFAAAFAALGVTAEQVLADTELLTSVLTYHVVEGAVDAATVVGLTSATTLNGADIAISVVGDGVVLNGSVNVVTTDIQACNGIIHVIDAVLLPPAAPAPTLPSTGVDSTWIMSLVALAFVAGGVAIVGVSRRRADV
jgi:transforming growth factor-beta-induced protein